MTARDIERLRQRIDDIDARLVDLLSERAACALEVGRLKEQAGERIYQPGRERQVLDQVRTRNPGPLDDDAMTRLFERIIDEARRLERVAGIAGDGRPDGPAGSVESGSE
jgi:chorismate mutase